MFDREAELKDAEIRIPAGSVAWLRGTDAWLDSDVSAGLRPGAEGVAVLYARYTSPRSWLRVTADAEGLRVQERLGERLYTLAHHAAPADTQTVRRIRLRTRNNRAWVWLDNQPVAENLPLTQRTRRGRVGLGSDQGDVSVSEFSASPLPSRWVLANSIRLVPDDKRDSVQAIFPNWFRAGEPPSLAETAQQDMLQAAVTGIRNAPLLTGVSTLNEKAARAWAAAIDAELLRTNMKMLAPALALDGPAFALADELRNRNYRVVHLLTPAHALEWGRSIAQVTPDEVIAVNGVGEEAERALTWLKRVIPASRLALREVDGAALAPHLSTMRRYESGAEL